MADGSGPTGDGDGDGEAVVAGAVRSPSPGTAGAGTGPSGGRGSHRRLRTVSSSILIVLACLLAVLSVVALYAKEQILDTDAYVATVAPLASDPAIQQQVATVASTQLVDQTGLQRRIQDVLPSRAGFLAAPLTAEVQSLAHTLALRYVESDRFAKLWTDLNRVAHTQVVNLLTGSNTGALASSNGEVTLDLSKVGAAVRAELVQRGVTVVDKIPRVKAPTLVLFRSAALVKLQRATKLLTTLAVLLPILTVLLLAAAVAAATDRRRGLVRAALGLAVAMAVVLVAIALSRSWYLSTYSDPGRKAAAAAALGAFSGMLVDRLRTILVVGLVVGGLAWVAGTAPVHRWAATRQLPRWLVSSSPHTFSVRHRRAMQGGTLALALVLLVVWSDPTALVAVVVVVVALALAGLIGLYARLPDPRRPPSPTG